jgi:hypothetical protein
MTHKDRIFINAIRDLDKLVLDDGAKVSDVINVGKHSARVVVQRPDGLVLKRFRVLVMEESS